MRWPPPTLRVRYAWSTVRRDCHQQAVACPSRRGLPPAGALPARGSVRHTRGDCALIPANSGSAAGMPNMYGWVPAIRPPSLTTGALMGQYRPRACPPPRGQGLLAGSPDTRLIIRHDDKSLEHASDGASPDHACPQGGGRGFLHPRCAGPANLEGGGAYHTARHVARAGGLSRASTPTRGRGGVDHSGMPDAPSGAPTVGHFLSLPSP